MDVQELSISNSVVLMAKVLIALVLAWGETVHVKTVMRILGLIGWCATPGRGHLRFLGSVYGAVFRNQSSFITVRPPLWQAMVTALVIAMPRFRPPAIFTRSWMLVKWIFVDAAQFYDRFDRLRFRVGVFDPVGDARAFDCPFWVNTQQVAELYGVWIVVGLAGRRRVGQLCMLQDNMQVIRATINLKSRSWFLHHNRI